MELLIIVVIIALVAIDAIGDSIIDETHKRNHILEAVAAGLNLSLIPLYAYSSVGIINMIAAYILIRAGLFNVIYNWNVGLPTFFVGTTDILYDKWMNKLPVPVIMTLYTVFVFFGIIAILYK